MTDPALLALPTTSPDLFHGHHPACGYTIEGDPKACDCEVRLRAALAAPGPTDPALRALDLAQKLGYDLVNDHRGIPYDVFERVDEIAATLAAAEAAPRQKPRTSHGASDGSVKTHGETTSHPSVHSETHDTSAPSYDPETQTFYGYLEPERRGFVARLLDKLAGALL